VTNGDVDATFNPTEQTKGKSIILVSFLLYSNVKG
jgi:hypothetical protein